MQRKMKDSGIPWIGMIPEEWEVCRLKNVGSLYGGLTGKAGDDFNVDDEKDEYSLFVPFTNIFNNDYIDRHQLYKVKTSKDEKQNEVKDGDILFLMSSEDYDGIGKSSLFNISIDSPVYLNSFCKGLRVKPAICFSRYLNYLMMSKVGRLFCQTSANGFIRINLRQEMLSKCPIFLPPLSEQEAIASWLDEKCGEIDELIDVEQKMIEELEAYRQATITETATRGLNPDVPMRQTNISWIPEIPEHWELYRIKYYADDYREKGDHGKYIGLENIISFHCKYIDTDSQYDLSQSLKAEEGDVLFGKLRPYLGKSLVIYDDSCCSSEFVIFKKPSVPEFLKYLLISNWFVTIVDSSTYGTKMPRANVDFIRNMTVPIPPFYEQRAIADYLDTKCKEIDDLIAVKRDKIETLKQYRQSIIFEAVTGKLQIS